MKIRTLLLLSASLASLSMQAETQNEGIQDTTKMSEVVVTGTRNATDARYLPMTVNTLNRQTLLANERTSVLPTIMEEVPGVLVTSRGMMGYGVSTGGSGSINVRGLASGTAQMLVLIDGHPQYQGIFGHGIADSYQTMIADRVEVLRGPASLLYGSNAMGGVVNIVTRKLEPNEDGKLSQHTTINAGIYLFFFYFPHPTFHFVFYLCNDIISRKNENWNLDFWRRLPRN